MPFFCGLFSIPWFLCALAEIPFARAHRAELDVLPFAFARRADVDDTSRMPGCAPPCMTLQIADLQHLPDVYQHKVLRIRGPVVKVRAGFFVYVLWAINQLRWAESMKVPAFVDMNSTGNHYFSPGRGTNFWEHYFEPANTTKHDPVPENNIMEMSQSAYPKGAAWYIHHSMKSVRTYNYKHGDEKLPAEWYEHNRQLANFLISKYVRVKPHLKKIVESFVAEHFGPVTLGVHLRGTDKHSDTGGHINGPNEYHPYITKFKAAHSHGKIFLATDDPKLLKTMTEQYGKELIVRDVQRSEGNIFQSAGGDNYLKGEEVLVDSLLLAMCDFLIKPSSAVSEFAVYFNLGLHNRSVDFGMPNEHNEGIDFGFRSPKPSLSVLRNP